jgi:hypothetical protein
LPDAQWNLAVAEGVIKDAARVGQLKPDPKFEALGNWYASRAKAQSLRSTSPTFTPQIKQQFLDGAIADIRKAIEQAPNDPGSWDWRSTGAMLIGTKLFPATATAEMVKTLGAEGRQWINDAITIVGKRPDLSGQLERLQRVQQQLETVLASKKPMAK